MITVSETWIDNLVTDSEISIKVTIFQGKTIRSGGGECVYIRSYISFAYRTDMDNNNLESLRLELYLPKNKPIIVGVCYRPPTDTIFNIPLGRRSM